MGLTYNSRLLRSVAALRQKIIGRFLQMFNLTRPNALDQHGKNGTEAKDQYNNIILDTAACLLQA